MGQNVKTKLLAKPPARVEKVKKGWEKSKILKNLRNPQN